LPWSSFAIAVLCALMAVLRLLACSLGIDQAFSQLFTRLGPGGEVGHVRGCFGKRPDVIKAGSAARAFGGIALSQAIPVMPLVVARVVLFSLAPQ